MIVRDYGYPLHSVEQRKDFREMLDKTCERFGEHLSFFEKTADGPYRGISYNAFRTTVRCLGEALHSIGFSRRDRVALIGRNCRTWAVSYYALVSSDFIVVPIDKEISDRDMAHVMEKAGVRGIIFENRYADTIARLPAQPALQVPFESDTAYAHSIESLISRGKRLTADGGGVYDELQTDPDEVAAIIFTSGTTGSAKGVMLSQRNMISNIVQMQQLIRVRGDMVFLSVLPLHHVYECTCGFLCMVHAGVGIAYTQSLKKIAENLVESRATNINVVPLLLESFCKKIRDGIFESWKTRLMFRIGLFACAASEAVLRRNVRRKLFRRIHERLGGRLDLFITGGAAANPGISRFLRKLGFRVLQGYGITECSPFLSGNRDHFFRDAAAGLPSPGCDIRIFDRNRKGVGEIGVKGPNVMLGYYNEPGLTAAAFRDGYFLTGDLGYLDRHNFLYIKGRIKDVLVAPNGKNIYPEEIEFLFAESTFIREIVILEGVPPRGSGHAIVAHLVPAPDAFAEELGKPIEEISSGDMIPILRGEIREKNMHLHHYERIRYFYIHSSEFERTTTKKVKRFMVKPEGKMIAVSEKGG